MERATNLTLSLPVAPKDSKRIQAVTFDVGGTLIEPWPSVGQVYAEVAAGYGLKNLSVETLNRQFAGAWRAKKNFRHARADWARLVDQAFAGLTEMPPSQTFFPQLYQRFAQAEVWRIFDDVLPAIDALASRGVRLGVVSNWDERLRPLLQQLQLDRYFETIIASGEIGFTKPSPVIFEVALRKLGLPAEVVLHVGDSHGEDVEGAKAAGLQAFLIERGGKPSGGTGIKSLAEILRWLD